ncbi:MAG TPA: hypothetical protein VGE08_15375 [Steroidobacter sp.]
MNAQTAIELTDIELIDFGNALQQTKQADGLTVFDHFYGIGPWGKADA